MQQKDSPTAGAGCAQDKLEPVLLEAARSHGVADLRFGQEVVELVQHDDVVVATVVDRASGRGTAVRAEWVIAADGAESPIRSMLGIRMIGPGALFHRMGIYFRADLRDVGRDRPALLYMLSPPEGPGVWGFKSPIAPLHHCSLMSPTPGPSRRPRHGGRVREVVRCHLGLRQIKAR